MLLMIQELLPDLHMHVEVMGCPTTCQHCWAVGRPYQAMPLEEVISLRLDRLMGSIGKFEDTSHPFSSQEHPRLRSRPEGTCVPGARFRSSTCAFLMYHSSRESGKRSLMRTPGNSSYKCSLSRLTCAKIARQAH